MDLKFGIIKIIIQEVKWRLYKNFEFSTNFELISSEFHSNFEQFRMNFEFI